MAPTLKKSIPKPFPDSLASGYGEDEYGLWQSFTVKGVCCRMRWINPGTFMMGSPENEPERISNERQHEVTISQGFWLAETACTQALWQSVMGENPSRFKDEQRPVENVSWNDCQKFIQALNERQPGLELRLPTEAEWEYACRAGATTPFSFGGNITPEQVNYNGEYSYNNAEKGEKRGKTVAVKSLPCNNWGLYEMHGNVWEWCNDWYGVYPSMPVIDPSGPETGSSRVLRGGGWFNRARLCRSAYRSRLDPDSRLYAVGFRLARGQKSRETGSGAEGGHPRARHARGDGHSW